MECVSGGNFPVERRTSWEYLEFLDASFRVSIWSFWRFHLEFKAFGNKLRESTWMIRLDWHRPSECRRGNIFGFWEIVFDSKVIKLSRICLFLFGRTTPDFWDPHDPVSSLDTKAIQHQSLMKLVASIQNEYPILSNWKQSSVTDLLQTNFEVSWFIFGV